MESTPYFTDTGVLVFGRSGTMPTPPALVANVVLRLILCPIAILLTCVPLRLLWRNGEFPACVFVLNLWFLIIIVFVNAAIWHNQDFSSWWLGYGWCDLQAFVQYALVTIYSTSVCAIMQRLANQVGLTRVTGLSSREKRKRLIMQSLIIFPVPILQIIVTIFVQGQRYALTPASGCTNTYNATAVFLVFFILPPLFFTIIACYHTFQTYRRFRQVDESSQAALGGTNSVAYARRQRARRKLYFMVLCILVPYTPIITAFCSVNLIEGWPWNFPSDFNTVHYHGPVPYNSISVLSYTDLSFLSLNMSWIPVVSAFIAFVFFGTSKEAINIYREYLLAVGLGRLFPVLQEVYDPDRTAFDSQKSQNSNFCNTATQFSTLDSISQSRKGSCASIYPTASTAEGEVTNMRSPRSSSFFHRVFRKGSTASPATTGDVELTAADARPAPLAAAEPSSRVPFNPGFNCFTPPMVFEPSPSVTWSPITYAISSATGESSKMQQSQHLEQAPGAGPSSTSPHPPTSAGSTAASTAPIFAANANQATGRHRFHFYTSTARPFDGTRSNSIGGSAVSTHVWSDSSEEPLPASALSLGNAAESNGPGNSTRGCKSEDNLGGQQQQGVRVDRTITTSEVIRKV
ncbi:a-factor receptor [Sporothrix stenoceras]|uniref:A-factor receptor n=1 Tax=Sporothrix stenoceras TaxID=5173 RepID=A0ABR3YND9_9PEZI